MQSSAVLAYVFQQTAEGRVRETAPRFQKYDDDDHGSFYSSAVSMLMPAFSGPSSLPYGRLRIGTRCVVRSRQSKLRSNWLSQNRDVHYTTRGLDAIAQPASCYRLLARPACLMVQRTPRRYPSHVAGGQYDEWISA